MKKKILSVLLLCMLLSTVLMSLTVSAAKEKFSINTASVFGYHPPLLTETAGENIGDLWVNSSAGYTLGGAKWYKYNSFGEWVVMGNNEKFFASTNYYLEFTLVKKSGYGFSDDCIPYVNDNTFYTSYYEYGKYSDGRFIFSTLVTQANTGSLVVNGARYYTGEDQCGPGWYWEADERTLELNKYNGSEIYFEEYHDPEPLRIKLFDNNTIASNSPYYSLYSPFDIVLTGEGFLTVSSQKAMHGISAGGNISIFGSGNIDVKGTIALYAKGEVEIDGSGTLTAEGTATGIYSDSNIVFAGTRNVNIKAGNYSCNLGKNGGGVFFNGTAAELKFTSTADGAQETIYNSADKLCRVGGISYDSYEITGSPATKSVTYTYDPSEKYDVYAGGIRFKASKLTIGGVNGGTATYDPKTKTMTLQDYNGFNIRSGDVLNLVLNGKNTVKCPLDSKSAGIFTDGALTISGSGSLNVKNDCAGCEGIRTNGRIIINNSGNIAVEALGIGIYADDMALMGNKEVKVQGGDSAVYMIGSLQISGSGDFTVIGTKNGVTFQNKGFALLLDGSANKISIKAGNGYKAVFCAADNNSPVQGINLGKYLLTGAPSGTSAVYQLHTHVYDQKKTEGKYLKSEATCVSKAVYYYSCTCGAIGDKTFESGDIAAHKYSSEWSRDDSKHWHGCTVCTDKKDEAAHTFIGNTCKVCGYVRPTTECKHTKTEIRGAKAATCTVNGYTGDTVCSDCGITVKKGTSVAAKGHKESDWIIDKAAEVGKDGSKHTECTVCHTKMRTEAIPALTEKCEHKTTEKVNGKDGNCTENGYTGDTVCKDCGSVLEKGKETPKNPDKHISDESGVCRLCGKTVGYDPEETDPADGKETTESDVTGDPDETTSEEGEETTSAAGDDVITGLGNLLWIVIAVLGGMVLIGIAAVVVIIILKKKKNG